MAKAADGVPPDLRAGGVSPAAAAASELAHESAARAEAPELQAHRPVPGEQDASWRSDGVVVDSADGMRRSTPIARRVDAGSAPPPGWGDQASSLEARRREQRDGAGARAVKLPDAARLPVNRDLMMMHDSGECHCATESSCCGEGKSDDGVVWRNARLEQQQSDQPVATISHEKPSKKDPLQYAVATDCEIAYNQVKNYKAVEDLEGKAVSDLTYKVIDVRTEYRRDGRFSNSGVHISKRDPVTIELAINVYISWRVIWVDECCCIIPYIHLGTLRSSCNNCSSASGSVVKNHFENAVDQLESKLRALAFSLSTTCSKFNCVAPDEVKVELKSESVESGVDSSPSWTNIEVPADVQRKIKDQIAEGIAGIQNSRRELPGPPGWNEAIADWNRNQERIRREQEDIEARRVKELWEKEQEINDKRGEGGSAPIGVDDAARRREIADAHRDINRRYDEELERHAKQNGIDAPDSPWSGPQATDSSANRGSQSSGGGERGSEVVGYEDRLKDLDTANNNAAKDPIDRRAETSDVPVTRELTDDDIKSPYAGMPNVLDMTEREIRNRAREIEAIVRNRDVTLTRYQLDMLLEELFRLRRGWRYMKENKLFKEPQAFVFAGDSRDATIATQPMTDQPRPRRYASWGDVEDPNEPVQIVYDQLMPQQQALVDEAEQAVEQAFEATEEVGSLSGTTDSSLGTTWANQGDKDTSVFQLLIAAAMRQMAENARNGSAIDIAIINAFPSDPEDSQDPLAYSEVEEGNELDPDKLASFLKMTPTTSSSSYSPYETLISNLPIATLNMNIFMLNLALLQRLLDVLAAQLKEESDWGADGTLIADYLNTMTSVVGLLARYTEDLPEIMGAFVREMGVSLLSGVEFTSFWAAAGSVALAIGTVGLSTLATKSTRFAAFIARLKGYASFLGRLGTSLQQRIKALGTVFDRLEDIFGPERTKAIRDAFARLERNVARTSDNMDDAARTAEGAVDDVARSATKTDNAARGAGNAIDGKPPGWEGQGGGKKPPGMVGREVAKPKSHVPNGPMKGKRVGHTFEKHGSHNTHQLQKEASATGKEVGQWTDDVAAEEFIAENLGMTSQGTVDVPIPDGIGRVVMPDGSFKSATHVRLVPSKSGVKTAFPIAK